MQYRGNLPTLANSHMFKNRDQLSVASGLPCLAKPTGIILQLYSVHIGGRGDKSGLFLTRFSAGFKKSSVNLNNTPLKLLSNLL
jgi:hypothetical protein